MKIFILALVIIGLICVAWFLCEISNKEDFEEYKPIKRIEKIYIKSSFTKNQKRICKKLNEVIDRLNEVD